MRMTVTNGNARNKIPFRARHGLTVCTIVPSVRAAPINLARATAWAEGVDRHAPATPAAEQPDTKAALVVSHRGAFV